MFDYVETPVVVDDDMESPKPPLDQLQSNDSLPPIMMNSEPQQNELNELENFDVDLQMDEQSPEYGGDVINPMEDAAYFQGSFYAENPD